MISMMRNMPNHPNDVPSEWLTEVSTSSMMPATTRPQSLTKYFLTQEKDYELMIQNQGTQGYWKLNF